MAVPSSVPSFSLRVASSSFLTGVFSLSRRGWGGGRGGGLEKSMLCREISARMGSWSLSPVVSGKAMLYQGEASAGGMSTSSILLACMLF